MNACTETFERKDEEPTSLLGDGDTADYAGYGGFSHSVLYGYDDILATPSDPRDDPFQLQQAELATLTLGSPLSEASIDFELADNELAHLEQSFDLTVSPYNHGMETPSAVAALSSTSTGKAVGRQGSEVGRKSQSQRPSLTRAASDATSASAASSVPSSTSSTASTESGSSSTKTSKLASHLRAVEEGEMLEESTVSFASGTHSFVSLRLSSPQESESTSRAISDLAGATKEQAQGKEDGNRLRRFFQGLSVKFERAQLERKYRKAANAAAVINPFICWRYGRCQAAPEAFREFLSRIVSCNFRIAAKTDASAFRSVMSIRGDNLDSKVRRARLKGIESVSEAWEALRDVLATNEISAGPWLILDVDDVTSSFSCPFIVRNPSSRRGSATGAPSETAGKDGGSVIVQVASPRRRIQKSVARFGMTPAISGDVYKELEQLVIGNTDLNTSMLIDAEIKMHQAQNATGALELAGYGGLRAMGDLAVSWLLGSDRGADLSQCMLNRYMLPVNGKVVPSESAGGMLQLSVEGASERLIPNQDTEPQGIGCRKVLILGTDTIFPMAMILAMKLYLSVCSVTPPASAQYFSPWLLSSHDMARMMLGIDTCRDIPVERKSGASQQPQGTPSSEEQKSEGSAMVSKAYCNFGLSIIEKETTPAKIAQHLNLRDQFPFLLAHNVASRKLIGRRLCLNGLLHPRAGFWSLSPVAGLVAVAPAAKFPALLPIANHWPVESLRIIERLHALPEGVRLVDLQLRGKGIPSNPLTPLQPWRARALDDMIQSELILKGIEETATELEPQKPSDSPLVLTHIVLHRMPVCSVLHTANGNEDPADRIEEKLFSQLSLLITNCETGGIVHRTALHGPANGFNIPLSGGVLAVEPTTGETPDESYRSGYGQVIRQLQMFESELHRANESKLEQETKEAVDDPLAIYFPGIVTNGHEQTPSPTELLARHIVKKVEPSLYSRLSTDVMQALSRVMTRQLLTPIFVPGYRPTVSRANPLLNSKIDLLLQRHPQFASLPAPLLEGVASIGTNTEGGFPLHNLPQLTALLPHTTRRAGCFGFEGTWREFSQQERAEQKGPSLLYDGPKPQEVLPHTVAGRVACQTKTTPSPFHSSSIALPIGAIVQGDVLIKLAHTIPSNTNGTNLMTLRQRLATLRNNIEPVATQGPLTVLELQFNTSDIITMSYGTAAIHHAELESQATPPAKLQPKLPLQPFLRFTKTDLDAAVEDESFISIHHSDAKALAANPVHAQELISASGGVKGGTDNPDAGEERGWFRRLLRKDKDEKSGMQGLSNDIKLTQDATEHRRTVADMYGRTFANRPAIIRRLDFDDGFAIDLVFEDPLAWQHYLQENSNRSSASEAKTGELPAQVTTESPGTPAEALSPPVTSTETNLENSVQGRLDIKDIAERLASVYRVQSNFSDLWLRPETSLLPNIMNSYLRGFLSLENPNPNTSDGMLGAGTDQAASSHGIVNRVIPKPPPPPPRGYAYTNSACAFASSTLGWKLSTCDFKTLQDAYPHSLGESMQPHQHFLSGGRRYTPTSRQSHDNQRNRTSSLPRPSTESVEAASTALLPGNAHLFPSGIYGTARMKANPEARCLVCLEEFQAEDEYLTLPCFHTFHKDCIARWLSQKFKCPECNTQFS